jgi:hypothetical protein
MVLGAARGGLSVAGWPVPGAVSGDRPCPQLVVQGRSWGQAVLRSVPEDQPEAGPGQAGDCLGGTPSLGRQGHARAGLWDCVGRAGAGLSLGGQAWDRLGTGM